MRTCRTPQTGNQHPWLRDQLTQGRSTMTRSQDAPARYLRHCLEAQAPLVKARLQHEKVFEDMALNCASFDKRKPGPIQPEDFDSSNRNCHCGRHLAPSPRQANTRKPAYAHPARARAQRQRINDSNESHEPPRACRRRPYRFVKSASGLRRQHGPLDLSRDLLPFALNPSRRASRRIVLFLSRR